MSSRDGDRRRVLSYEERVLWTTVTKAIAPLRTTARIATFIPGESPPLVNTAIRFIVGSD